jgi:hypothetical protein
MESLKIVLMCILAAVIYGIVHDQITARVCVEYFTIGHPPILGTDDPTWLGIGWGIVATWWVGLLLGLPLAAAAQAGVRPKRSAASLQEPIARLVGPIALRVPPDRHAEFLADLWAHLASYLVGFVGGNVLIVQVRRSRVVAQA